MTLSKKWKTLWRKRNDADTEWATSGRSRRYYWRREALRQLRREQWSIARAVLLNHVDSQAQKIADQAKEIEKLKANRSLVPLDSEHERLR